VYETIRYEQNGAVVVLSLNRPDKLNALTADMLRELRDAFQQAGQDETVRAVVLTGSGRGFCAGQDLAMGGDPNRDYGDIIRSTYNPLIETMTRLEKPIVCAVNGVAAGAGVSLALACDLRVAADTAWFVQAFVNIGLIPDSGGTWFLPRLVGLTRAMELALLGERVSAEDAARIGLVNRVVPADQLETETMRLAERLAQLPTRAIGLIKRAHYEGLNLSLSDALELEAQLQAEAGRTEDHKEGIRAFLEKRPPQFRGR
jgi:2-(1,2-epoxy-1,2-dihydrophenyl)acetyl-CoA isomerase